MGVCYNDRVSVERTSSGIHTPGGMDTVWKQLKLPIDVLRAGLHQLPLQRNPINVVDVLEVLWAVVLREYQASDAIAYRRIVDGDGDEGSCDVALHLDQDTLESLPGRPSLISLIAARGAQGGVQQPFSVSKIPNHGRDADINTNTAVWITTNNDTGSDTAIEPSLLSWSAACNMIVEILHENEAPEGPAQAKFWYRSPQIDDDEARRVVGTFRHSMCHVLSANDRDIDQLDLLSPEDRDQLRQWVLPQVESSFAAISTSLPQVLQESVQKHAYLPAIEDSDGCWTYRELQHNCHALALHLLGVGVQPGDAVLLMREKSKWTVAAIIAVLMTGAVCVPLDTRQAQDRIRSIIKSTSARFILISENMAQRRDAWAPLHEICVSADLFTPEEISIAEIPEVHHDATAFIFFTSGSTGIPKGVVQPHGAVASTTEQISRAMRMDSSTRTFQYSSYSFDVSVGDIFATIFAGGCLCVPSEAIRLDNPQQSLNDMKATHICVTPTTLTKLDPKGLPSIRQVTVGGESLTREQLQAWCPRIATIYGTTESIIWDTYHADVAEEDSPTNIGRAMGPITTWIVNTWNSSKLVPVGAIGELLVGGPLLSRGYLNDVHRTRESFPEGAPWSEDFVGAEEPKRLYRTGDLARYSPDGTLQYLGRKDRQIKLAGQRVELGDIEYALRQSFPPGTSCAAEMICPESRQGQEVLVAFVGTPEEEHREASWSLTSIRRRLAELLPMYMIPSLFIPLEGGIPTTSTGKVDRSKLRQLGSQLSAADALRDGDDSDARRSPITPMETLVQRLCSEALGHIVDSEQLSMNANFFQSGGTSIQAMQLVSAARSEGFSLSVVDVFENPRLADLADIIRPCAGAESRDEDVEIQVAPFSLLAPQLHAADIQTTAASCCAVQPSQVQDVFPCTDLQEGMLALSSKTAGDYIQQAVIEISPTVDLVHFRHAYERAADLISIFRCRAFALPEANYRIHLAIIDQSEEWHTDSALQQCCHRDRQHLSSSRLGDRLVRCSLVVDSTQRQYFVWTIHHALFDGWSLSLMLDEIERQLLGRATSHLLPFQNFLHYLQNVLDYDACRRFWRARLDGASQLLFPRSISSVVHSPSRTITSLSHSVTGVQWPSIGVTPSTVIQGAWAVLLAQRSATLDVVFGSTVIGRHATVPGIERIAGPTIATVPQRVRLDPCQSASQYLQQLQLDAIRTAPYEHLGLTEIARVSSDAESASAFQTLLVIQPPEDDGRVSDSELHILDRRQIKVMGALRTYAMSLQCWIGSAGSAEFQLEFDEKALDPLQGESMLAQLEHTLRALCTCADSRQDSKLATVFSCGDADRAQISRWNGERPPPPSETVLDLIAAQVATNPEHLAVDSWDGSLTYRQLDDQAWQLAQQILASGDKHKPSRAVVICMEKSCLAVVALMAVLKAGQTCVLLDSSCPSQRAKTIIERSRAHLALTDEAQSHRLNQWTRTIPFSKKQLSNPPSTAPRVFRQCLPTDDACIIFTSGSTGEPKAISWNHRTVAANALEVGAQFGFSSSSRVFQFSSYAFDVSIHETMATLIAGGCLCVPSEQSRGDALQQSIVSFNASAIILTPSVAEVLDPECAPCLETVVLCGEPLPLQIARKWSKSIRAYDWYGPGECSMATCSLVGPAWQEGNVGMGTSTMTWIVHENNHDILQPIGSVGELLLQGPCVASCYVDDDVRTAESFIKPPQWWQQCYHDVDGKDIRLYKTGDLARYNGDGSIVLLGRKDTQVKIRGQRVELGETQAKLYELLEVGSSVAVELIDSQDDHQSSVLAAFVQRSQDAQKDRIASEHWSQTTQAQLSESLPTYMVPTVFFDVREIPWTPTGKVDRQKLQALGTSLLLQCLKSTSDDNGSVQWVPSTRAEAVLSKIWSEVLNLAPAQMSADAHFIRLGGNSIDAMRLAAAASGAGYSLSVRDILTTPLLEALARQMQPVERGTSDIDQASVSPFSIAPANAQYEAASQCGLQSSQIEDVFPCTALQTALLALTSRRPGDYISRNIYHIDGDLDLFKASWETVAAATPILRTRIVDLGGEDFYQAVVDDRISWNNTCETIGDYLQNDQHLLMGLGTPLVRWGIVPAQQNHGSSFTFIWTIHHSLFDGWSLRAILDQVERAYTRQTPKRTSPFQEFIKHTADLGRERTAEEFWKRRLDGAVAPLFPALPFPRYGPRATSTLEHRASQFNALSRASHVDYTISTHLRAAWSLVIAQYSRSTDIVFGTTVLGRQVPVPGISDMIGPTIATVPVRVCWTESDTLQSLLQTVHQDGINAIPFEQVGLQRLRRLGPGPEEACRFQSMLIVQPPREKKQSGVGLFDNFAGDDSVGLFSSTALMLRCSLTDHDDNSSYDHVDVQFHLDFDPLVIDEKQARRIVCQMDHTLCELSSAPESTKMCDLRLLSRNDLEEILLWNGDVPKPAETTVDRLFRDAVQKSPSALAVHAWDAELTFEELDRYAASVAHSLISLGLKPQVRVPLYFEKSAWTIVAIFAVFKTGATAVLLEPSQPDDRLRSILDRINAPLVVTSARNEHLASKLFPCLPVVVVDASVTTSMVSSPGILPQPSVDSSSPVYIVFTSGSTGTPKGVVVTHGNVCSALKHRQPKLSYHRGDRVLDGVSYAFDVSWGNIIFTLCSGACLCVPATLKDIGASLQEYRVTAAGIAPSLARLLDSRQYPNLKTMILGSEPPRPSDTEGWTQQVDVFNSYGPAECTVSVSAGLLNGEDRIHVGRGMGARMWIVDDNMGDKCLASIGRIGELWIEGPQVASGYLDDPDTTAAAFFEGDLAWLPPIPSGVTTGKRRRFYRTGDLAQYYWDGMIRLVGRRDTQVKLRGQRIELEEVEHHVKKQIARDIEIAAEVIIPRSDSSRQFLVIFAVADPDSGLPDERVKSLRHGTHAELSKALPSYMCPSAYIPLEVLPRLPGGKVNRRRLREAGAMLSVEELTQPMKTHNDTDQAKTPPRTPVEQKLRQLWASTLGLPPSAISVEDSFLQLDGGDSIGVMRLVRLALDHGMCFSVADVFSNPTLCDLATKVVFENATKEPVIPFSLVQGSWSDDRLRHEAAAKCDIHPEQVEDIFPCTALQGGLLALSSSEPSLYTHSEIFELNDSVDVDRLRGAWDRVAASIPILRTRVIDLHPHGLHQVVVKEQISWIFQDVQHMFNLGSRLVHWALVERAGSRQVVWTIHHSLYDGWSMPRVLQLVEQAYDQVPLRPYLSMQPFIRYLSTVSDDDSQAFWNEQLSEAPPPSFPSLPSASHQARATQSCSAYLPNFEWPAGVDVSPSNWIRVAWALLVGHVMNTEDITFGATVSGRQVPLAGIQDVLGPTIATVPIRIRIDWAAPIRDFAHQVQMQAVSMIPFEQIGLHNLRRVSEDAMHASEFRTLLNVQPAPIEAQSNHIWTRKTDGTQGQFNNFALILDCELQDTGVSLQLDFDGDVIQSRPAERLVHQLEDTLLQLARNTVDLTKPLADFNPISSQDLSEIWQWNADLPEEVPVCLHDTIHGHVQRSPQSPAVHAWDGQLTYEALDRQSTSLASYLQREHAHEVGDGCVIALYFEKSMWTVVAAMAVMKTGSAFTLMDASQPEERLRQIVSQVNKSVIISSALKANMCAGLAKSVVVVDHSSSLRWPPPQPSHVSALPTSKLYVVFTSGSTGTPKGAIITHSNFSSAVKHQGSFMGYNSNTRVYDFASYSFDIAISNLLHCLAAGGCLCIPSDSERKQSQLAESMERMKVNLIDLTPSVARALDPAAVPSLKTLVLGGESAARSDIVRWAPHARVLNGIGQAECTVTTTMAEMDPAVPGTPGIGQAMGTNVWIVSPTDHNQLVAIGAVGELIVEGPLVGAGYLNDEEKTAAAFIQDPVWLTSPPCSIAQGRHGRLYKTGDLVRYDAHGGLHFIGRKDAQAKIRGQRIELEEVEYHVQRMLSALSLEASIAAEALLLNGASIASAVLVVFVCPATMTDADKGTDDENALCTLDLSFFPHHIRQELSSRLENELPSAMVPFLYVPVNRIPLSPTGKTDRKRLKALGASLTVEQVAKYRGFESMPKRSPVTADERHLRDLWAGILGLSVDNIGIDDNFVQLGGDSISAMRLVSLARSRGMALDSKNLLSAGSALSDLASAANDKPVMAMQQDDLPFSQIPTTDIEKFHKENIAPHIELPLSEIVDILPGTEFQAFCIKGAVQHSRPSYWNYFFIDFQSSEVVDTLSEACRAVAMHLPILRTVFVPFGSEYLQVVTKNWVPDFDHFDCRAEAIPEVSERLAREEWQNVQANTGARFCRFMLVRANDKPESARLIIRMSHSLYDGISLDQLLQTMVAAIEKREIPRIGSFASFIKHSRSITDRASQYWSQLLSGSSMTRLAVQSKIEPIDKSVPYIIRESVSWQSPLPPGITAATFCTACWAAVVASTAKQDDVVFGRLVSGRGATLDVIADPAAGPCLNVVPTRVTWLKGDDHTSLSPHEVSTSIQKQQTDGMPFESTGLSQIINTSTDWDPHTNYGSVFQYQNIDESLETTALGVPIHLDVIPMEFSPEQLWMLVKPRGQELEVLLFGTTGIMAEEEARALADLFCKYVGQGGVSVDS